MSVTRESKKSSKSITYHSQYVPMLHYDFIRFKEVDALVTLEASSCFAFGIVHVNTIQANNTVTFSGAYLAHLNVGQLGVKTIENDIANSISSFKKGMKDVNSGQYVAFICGGAKEDNTSEAKIINSMKKAGITNIHNFRSVYSCTTTTLLQKGVNPLKEEKYLPSEIKDNGYLKQVSVGITKDRIFFFSENKLYNKDLTCSEAKDGTALLSEIALYKSNVFSLMNPDKNASCPEKVAPVHPMLFKDMFNKNKALEIQFFRAEIESQQYLSGENTPDMTLTRNTLT